MLTSIATQNRQHNTTPANAITKVSGVSRISFKVLPLALVLVASSHAVAAGFATNLQSGKSLAQAGAGKVSMADDASVVVANPAGISFLNQPQLALAALYIKPKFEFDTTSTAQNVHLDDAVIPAFFAAFPVPESMAHSQFSTGVGVYMPYKLASDYVVNLADNNQQTAQQDIQVLTLQPTLSYELQSHPRVSIGVGLTVNQVKADFMATNPYYTSQLNNKDMGYGFSYGVMAESEQGSQFGVVYRSKVDYTLGDNVPVYGMAVNNNLGYYPASFNLTTPASLDLSASLKANDSLTLHGSYSRTFWSDVTQIQPRLRLSTTDMANKLVNMPVNQVQTVVNTFNQTQQQQSQIRLTDTNLYALGLSYITSPTLTLRAGVALEDSPVSINKNLAMPTGKGYLYTLGVGWAATPNINVDAMAGYMVEDDITFVDTTSNSPLTDVSKKRSKLASMQVSYNF